MGIRGGCLCGRVRYEVRGPLFRASHCHCSMCRRQHGAAYATYAGCNPEDFHWLSGEEAVKVYQSKLGGGWCFCCECGSTLAGTDRGQVTSVALGTVEGDPGIRPGYHIFVGFKAQWHEICDDLPQYQEQAPSSEKADHSS